MQRHIPDSLLVFFIKPNLDFHILHVYLTFKKYERSHTSFIELSRTAFRSPAEMTSSHYFLLMYDKYPVLRLKPVRTQQAVLQYKVVSYTTLF